MYREKIHRDGYVILKSVFTKEQLENWTNEILQFIKSQQQIQNSGGITIPDFLRWPALHSVGLIKENHILHTILTDIFSGTDYRFCQHNDIGINRVVGWHKDKLNGEYAKYQTTPIWSDISGERHEIVKVLIYLQDTSDNKDGLWVVPGSHLDQKLHGQGAVYIPTEPGDVIIFDQRINHRGTQKQISNTRILVSFGFGKNNQFTDEFERGTIARQNDQNMFR
jgi:hypothetical protein